MPDHAVSSQAPAAEGMQLRAAHAAQPTWTGLPLFAVKPPFVANMIPRSFKSIGDHARPFPIRAFAIDPRGRNQVVSAQNSAWMSLVKMDPFRLSWVGMPPGAGMLSSSRNVGVSGRIDGKDIPNCLSRPKRIRSDAGPSGTT